MPSWLVEPRQGITNCLQRSISENRRLCSIYGCLKYKMNHGNALVELLDSHLTPYTLHKSNSGGSSGFSFSQSTPSARLTCILKCLYFLIDSKWSMQIRLCFLTICLILFYKAKLATFVVVLLLCLVNRMLFVTFTLRSELSWKNPWFSELEMMDHRKAKDDVSSCLEWL